MLDMASISTAPGQPLDLTCTNTTSDDPIPTRSNVPFDAAARVHKYPAASSILIDLYSFFRPFAAVFTLRLLSSPANAYRHTESM